MGPFLALVIAATSVAAHALEVTHHSGSWLLTPTDTTSFVTVEQPPKPVGGLDAINARVRYPELARRAGIEGTVVLEFVVGLDGAVEEITCLRDPGGGTCEAAAQAVRETTFLPGRHGGQAVSVRFTMPIRFTLTPPAGTGAESEPPGPPQLRPYDDEKGERTSDYRVFPNPAVDRLTIVFSLNEPARVRLELFDLSGRVMLQPGSQRFDAGANHEIEIDVSHLLSGTYVYRLHLGRDVATGQIRVAGTQPRLRLPVPQPPSPRE